MFSLDKTHKNFQYDFQILTSAKSLNSEVKDYNELASVIGIVLIL
jgi:hypothetical protein